MNQKHLQNIDHVCGNASLMVENVTQIKTGITINVGASVRIEKRYRVCEKDYI